MNSASAGISMLACLSVLASCADRAEPALDYTRLDVPGAGATVASGVNAAGDLVGAARDSSGVQHGFVARRPRS